MTDKFWRYLLITDSYMQWNLINLKCKIVPYTPFPILLPETSSVALFGACVMCLRNRTNQHGGTTTSNRNAERYIFYCDNEERMPVK